MTNPDLFNENDPETILRTAAEAARRSLPLLVQQLAEQQAQIAATQSKIVRMKQLAALNDVSIEEPGHFENSRERKEREHRNRLAHQHILAHQFAQIDALVKGEGPPLVQIDSDNDPQAMTDIKRALFEVKTPMKVVEIGEYIKKMSGREWGQSTIYNHLKKGKTAGTFANANNQWSLTEQGFAEQFA